MAESESELIICGPELTLDIPACSLGQLVFKQLASFPPHHQLKIESESGRSVTTSEFLSLSVRAAQGLKALGAQEGDVIALIGKNGIDISAATTASLFLAAPACPIDPSMRSFEYQHMFTTIEPKFVLCDADVAQEVSTALTEVGNQSPIIIFCGEDDAAFTKFEDFLEDPTPEFRPTPVADNSQSCAFIVCSSGSTGFPKGVRLPDKTLLYQILLFQMLAANQGAEAGAMTLLHTSHFFWISGVVMFCSSICGGIKRVIVRTLSEVNILNAIQDYKPNFCALAPAHINGMLNHPDFDNYDVSSIGMIITAGSALQKTTLENLRAKWSPHVICTQAYGMSEVGGACTCISLGDDVMSVGRAMPGIQLKFVDISDGRTVGPMEEGEILIHSPAVMLGYTNNEEATREMIDDEGWVHTGDIGYHTEDKLIYISGRIKEFIKYQNLQIAPAELEHVIFAVPGVLDVGVAGVAVDADTYYPMALVVREDEGSVTEEDVMKAVNENMSDYKHLRAGVVFVEGIPRTPTGKIRRKELEKLAKILYMDVPLNESDV